MTAVMAQMFAGREPLNEETAFDIEFTDEHIVDGIYCQVQFEITPRAGFDAVGVDWGDGTKQDWPKASRTMAHNWSARGRYRVRLDKRLKWFRFTECWTVANGRTYASRPLLRPVQWGDFVESAQGTYCGWTGTREGRGIRGGIIPWGKSITSTFCCYERNPNLTGPFPKWVEYTYGAEEMPAEVSRAVLELAAYTLRPSNRPIGATGESTDAGYIHFTTAGRDGATAIPEVNAAIETFGAGGRLLW